MDTNEFTQLPQPNLTVDAITDVGSKKLTNLFAPINTEFETAAARSLDNAGATMIRILGSSINDFTAPIFPVDKLRLLTKFIFRLSRLALSIISSV